jgi:transcriptional regulator with PAS, ATPase and Fis domain
LEETERDEVRRVLAATGGNKTRTAQILGISKPRLYRLIEKHQLT